MAKTTGPHTVGRIAVTTAMSNRRRVRQGAPSRGEGLTQSMWGGAPATWPPITQCRHRQTAQTPTIKRGGGDAQSGAKSIHKRVRRKERPHYRPAIDALFRAPLCRLRHVGLRDSAEATPLHHADDAEGKSLLAERRPRRARAKRLLTMTPCMCRMMLEETPTPSLAQGVPDSWERGFGWGHAICTDEHLPLFARSLERNTPRTHPRHPSR